MIEITRVSRRYGPLLALDRVSLEVRPGQIVGLLGANGAGKSTLLRTAAGLQTPDSGSVHIVGIDLWQRPRDAKAHLGFAPEEPSFYEELSAEEYVAFLAGVRELDAEAARKRADQLFARLGLTGRTHEPVFRFSHGMRKKLSFIAAVLHRPKVLLFDEALEGFDVGAAIAAREELQALAEQGTAMLFSSHVTETIERQCDRAVILHRGRIVRILEREAWGAPRIGPSPLKPEFVMVLRPDTGTKEPQ